MVGEVLTKPLKQYAGLFIWGQADQLVNFYIGSVDAQGFFKLFTNDRGLVSFFTKFLQLAQDLLYKKGLPRRLGLGQELLKNATKAPATLVNLSVGLDGCGETKRFAEPVFFGKATFLDAVEKGF